MKRQLSQVLAGPGEDVICIFVIPEGGLDGENTSSEVLRYNDFVGNSLTQYSKGAGQ